MQCSATRKDGRPCTNTILVDATRCFAHSEARAADRAQARRKGGKAKANHIRAGRLAPERLTPLFEQVTLALQEAHDGDLDPKVAVAMAHLARAAVALFTTGEMELRLRALEEARDGTPAWPA